MSILSKRQKPICETGVATAKSANSEVYKIATECETLETSLYSELRAKVPVIDACISKIVRLTGGFTLIANEPRYQRELDRFSLNVPVGISAQSVASFADCYLDSLLTYGKAVGEIIINPKTHAVSGLYNADSDSVCVKTGKSALERCFYVKNGGELHRLKNTERILYTALNPTPANPTGTSILRGLPCLSGILLRIFECIGQNFDRVGNVRYAVTYKPSAEGEKAFAKERAVQIAREWSDGMSASRAGEVRDFVAVGDVSIKAIGADNQIIDTEVPVRQILEQIVAKLGIPPFLIGLNWSSTERMSAQQADILTSELEYYRRLLTPVILRIADTFLSTLGSVQGATIEWGNINLQDELELAQARLYNAQSAQLEYELEELKEGKAWTTQ